MAAKKAKLDKVRKIVGNALRKNAFCGKKLKEKGINSTKDLKTWKDFDKLPLVKREELAKDQVDNPPFGSNLNKKQESYKYFLETSGTSTGKPFRLPLSKGDQKRLVDLTYHVMKKVGINAKDGFCHFNQRQIYPLMTEAAQRAGARVIPLEENRLLPFLQNLNDLGVTVLQTTPTFLFRAMRLAKKNEINLKDSPIEKIITVAEAGGNTKSIKKLFEETWGARVIDLLGSSEAESLAINCKKGFYHLFDDFFIAEVFRDGKVKKEGKGELVLTTLWREDFPIIRYRTDDFVNLSKRKCACGLTSPRLIGGFLGRVSKAVNIQGILVYPKALDDILRDKIKEREYLAIVVKKSGIDQLEIYIDFEEGTTLNEINGVKQAVESKTGLECTVYPVVGSLEKAIEEKKQRFFDLRKEDYPLAFSKILLSEANLYTFKAKDYLTRIRKRFKEE